MQDTVAFAALLVCFFVGYWIFSKLLNRGARTVPPPPNGEADRRKHKNGTAPPPPPQEPKTFLWYDVLGVSEFDSKEAIVAAYRDKIRAYHPDRVAGLGPEFNEIADRKSKEINQAYQIAKKKRNIQ